MAVNLFDAADDLEKAIRDTDEFKQLKLAYLEVSADAIAKKMFDQFRQVQINLQQKQMMGQDISQTEIDQAQQAVVYVQQNEKISRLMQAEQQMGMIIGELNMLIMKPLEELYGTPAL